MKVSLTAEQQAFVDREVNAGRYANKSEVIRAAIRLLSEEAEQRVRLQAAVDRGLADIDEGRVSPFDSAEIKRKGRRRLAANR